MKRFSALMIFLFLSTFNLFSQDMNLPIVPKPQVTVKLNGEFKIPGKLKIQLSGLNLQENRFAAELIEQTLKNFNSSKAEILDSASGKAAIVLFQDKPAKFDLANSPSESNEEGYRLIISKDGIMLKATSPRGMLYAAMSLVQLLEKADNAKLQALEISDWPDMKFRGISDDVSRGQVPTLENFKKIIRFLARYKMNVYMPYLEDMIEFSSYPTIGQNRGRLTKAEIKELVEYAKKFYVDVIPAFQTLGHYENILAQEEFLKYAEFPGAASLCVSSDSTYRFLETMLKEVCELFPSEYFNMGADESYDVGLGKSKYMVDKSSLAMVHLEHYKKVYSMLRKYGKKVMMYGDIILSHPEILEGLPKDITVIDWHYRPDYDYPSTKVFAGAGHPYIVSPSVWNYTSIFPVNSMAVPNIKYMTASGLKNGSVGMINSNWGDYGAETIKELVYYGYAWSAQCAWNFKGSEEGKFARDFLYDFFGINDSRLVSLYETLNSPLNQVLWNEIWRHPMLPLREPSQWEARFSPVVKMSWMETALPKAEKDIHELEGMVKKNKDQFDLLKFTIKLAGWYKDKLSFQLLTAGKAAELFYKNRMDAMDRGALAYFRRNIEGQQIDKKAALPLAEKNMTTLKALKAEYKNLWLKYYKKDNLSMIEDKFDRLINYFDETRQQLNTESFQPAAIQSDWIYCKINDTTFARSAKFRKSFTLEEKPSSAYLQLLGDTYARLYINGQFVDQVYVKRSLSLLGDYKRIKFLEVAKYLKEGENTITVDVDNYLAKGAAGCNIIADIKAGGKSISLLTDTSWQVQEIQINETPFVNAAKKDYPYIITAPNFATKRTSWIER